MQVKPLVINDLTKSYGTLDAVKNVSFDIQPGEVFGLLGPNGAGKTSLISTIVTLERPSSGTVEVFGHDVVKEPKFAKAKVGIVPQELINHGYFNIEEVMHFHSGYYGVANNTEQINFLLKRMQLWEHRHKSVRQLSGGMKRRLLICKALVHKPKLLLLDEPTAGVDIELRDSLWEFVRELSQQGISILLTTHYLEEAEQLCDRVGIIHKGLLQKVGPTKELIKDLTTRVITLILKDETHLQHAMLESQEGPKYRFRIPNQMSVGDLMTETNLDVKNVVDLQIQEGSLEDAFKKVLGGAE